MGGGRLALRVAATWALARAGFSDTELGAGVQGRVLGVADMDGDGTLDVVTASADRFTVVYNTAEGFVATDSGADGSVAAVAALALADLDGDGAADVLLAAGTSVQIWQFDGDMTAPLILRWQTSGNSGAGCLDVLNFNGDGDPDFFAGRPEENLLSSYRRLGDDFVEGVVDNDAGGVVALVHADVNGDGDVDARVLGTEDGMAPNAIFGNVDVDGDGNLDLLGVDVDGDGDVDVLVASYFDDAVTWFENQGEDAAGTLQFAQHAVKSTSYARGLVEQVTGTWGDICLDETSLLGRDGAVLSYGDGSGGDNSASDALDTSAEYISRVRQASYSGSSQCDEGLGGGVYYELGRGDGRALGVFIDGELWGSETSAPDSSGAFAGLDCYSTSIFSDGASAGADITYKLCLDGAVLAADAVSLDAAETLTDGEYGSTSDPVFLDFPSPTAPTLVARYAFDGGDASDDSGNGMTGTIHGATATLPAAVTATLGAGAARTVCLWAKIGAFDGGGLFSYGAPADGREFSLRTYGDVVLRVQYDGEAFDADVALAGSDDGAWHHYCLAYDGAAWTLYYDGSQAQTATLALDTDAASATFKLDLYETTLAPTLSPAPTPHPTSLFSTLAPTPASLYYDCRRMTNTICDDDLMDMCVVGPRDCGDLDEETCFYEDCNPCAAGAGDAMCACGILSVYGDYTNLCCWGCGECGGQACDERRAGPTSAATATSTPAAISARCRATRPAPSPTRSTTPPSAWPWPPGRGAGDRHGDVGDIGSWDTSMVTDFSELFCASADDCGHTYAEAATFDEDVGYWDVSAAVTMKSMFRGCEHFDRDLGGWDVSAVTDMSHMFASAGAFDRDLGSCQRWCGVPVDDTTFLATACAATACGAMATCPAACASVSFAERVVTDACYAAYSVFAIDVDGDGDVDVSSSVAPSVPT
ncbi:hypothetical protein JL720_12152 [Aureococcus anophagefferens]|nr:hypothetical protein JL720_12152 [Aureococcus anophagefferens]